MKRIGEVKAKYDPTNETDRKKLILLEWFQKHPGKRFDRAEVHRELEENLEVGRGRVGQYLKQLEEESVLQSHGEQRKAYRLDDDILVPIKYQAYAGLRQLATIFDFARWGVVGFLIISSVLWFFLTFPFWFFSLAMLVSPMNEIGPLSEAEIYIFALLMTIWLLIFVIFSYAVFRVRGLWYSKVVSRQAPGSSD